jgi:hypothetical protein
MAYVITKWCKSITDSGKDEYTKREVKPEMVHKFRLKDDDDIVYCYGMSTSDSSFRPLDEVGADYGCTSIEYKNSKTGEYEPL